MATSKMHFYVAFADDPTGSLGDITGILGPDAPPTAGKWTELTAFCRGGRLKHGINEELGKIEAGELTQELVNTDHRFDRDNPSGPYHGFLEPKRRCRISFERGGVEHNRYTGFVQAWPNVYTDRVVGFAPVTAADLFETQRQGKSGKAYQANILSRGPAAYYKMDEASGTVMIDSSGNAVNGVWHSATVGQSPLIKEGGAVSLSGAAAQYGSVATNPLLDLPMEWAWCGWGQLSSWPAIDPCIFRRGEGSGTSAMVLQVYVNHVTHALMVSFEQRGWFYQATSAASAIALDTPFFWLVERDVNVFRVWLNGALLGQVNISNSSLPMTSALTFGGYAALGRWPGKLDEFAFFQDQALGPEAVADLYDAGTHQRGFAEETASLRLVELMDSCDFPGAGQYISADRNIQSGGVLLAADTSEGSTFLEYAEKIREAENGLYYADEDGKATFKLHGYKTGLTSGGTFGVGPGEIPYAEIETNCDPEEVYSDITGTRKGSAKTLSVHDQTSRDKYFGRTLEFTDTLHARDNDLYDFLGWLLLRHKYPFTRIPKLVFKPGMRDDIWDAVLNLKLFDRRTVKFTPAGANYTLTEDVHIDSITEEWSAVGDLVDLSVEYSTSPASEFASWVLGVTGKSEIGVNTWLGY